MKHKKSALVCSGGAALGVAHAGVVQALLEDKYKFDFYTGVSAGAIMVAGLAIGKTPKEIYEIVQELNLALILLDRSKNTYGINAGNTIYQTLQDIFGDTRIEDLPTPTSFGATNFTNGERVLISSGLIIDGLRASISIPVLFEPYLHPELKIWLVDGGLTQNFPLDTAIEQYQGEQIIGVDVCGVVYEKEDFGQKPFWTFGKDVTQAAQRTINIMMKAQQARVPTDPRVSIISPNLKDYSARSVGKKNFKAIYDIGYNSGKTFIQSNL